MIRSRRDFFRSLPGAAALPASWVAFTRTLEAAPGIPDATNEAYWRMVQRQFPLEDGLIFLHAANVCPASRPVLDRYVEFLRDFEANPSFQNREKYDPLQERLRSKLAAVLGASADEIAVTRNTSEGNNVVAKGIDLKAGDEVLITDHNHPSNEASWKMRAKREGFVVRSVPVTIPPPGCEQLLDGIVRAVTPRTKVIAVTHVTNTTGILYPVKELADFAHGRGIWMHLDGAQTFGALDVNVRAIGCDSYAASAHKWAMGPLEAGVLYVRSERIPELWPSIVTAGWSDRLVGARKFEVLGQRDNPRVVAFDAAVDFLQLLGMKNVEARMRLLANALKQKLREMPRVQLLTNLEPQLSGGVVKFRIRDADTRRAYDALWSRHRISGAMTPATTASNQEGIRLCPHIYNSLEQIDRTAAAVQELAG